MQKSKLSCLPCEEYCCRIALIADLFQCLDNLEKSLHGFYKSIPIPLIKLLFSEKIYYFRKTIKNGKYYQTGDNFPDGKKKISFKKFQKL